MLSYEQLETQSEPFIEAQRKMFEMALSEKYKYATFDTYESGEYRSSVIQSAFDGWLLCASHARISYLKSVEFMVREES